MKKELFARVLLLGQPLEFWFKIMVEMWGDVNG
jgi:hypothetical protein